MNEESMCRNVPPSSLAITSALSSTVQAMELLELPKVIPMTVRSLGATLTLDSLMIAEGV